MAAMNNTTGTRCLTHTSELAVNRCKSCNRPLCQACSKKLPGGVFCSDACAAKAQQHAQRYNDMKRRDEEDARNAASKAWRSRLVFLVVVIVVGGGLVMWLKSTNSALLAKQVPALIPVLLQLGLMH